MRKHCSTCPFQWEDYSTVDYVQWSPGEPNDAGDGEDCTEMNGWDGNWNDDDCNKEYMYVCEVYRDLEHKTGNNNDQNWPSNGGCKEGWIKYAKACYKMVGGVTSDAWGDAYHKKWNDANIFCSGDWSGASLAIFPNQFYNYYMAAQSRGFGEQYMWIGLSSTTQDFTYHWIDNTRLTFDNWEYGQMIHWFYCFIFEFR